MYCDGVVVTSGEKRLVHGGIYGVNTYKKDKCDFGYTLFSPSWGDREFLMDMNGLIVHTWKVTHSNVAELHADGNLVTHNCGNWVEELDPDGAVLWRWTGEDWMVSPNHHDYAWVSDDEVYSLGAIHEPVKPGMFPEGREPEFLRTDVVVRINKSKSIGWKFSFGEHIEELCSQAGLPYPIPYANPFNQARPAEVPGAAGQAASTGLCPSDWAHANTIEYLPDTSLGRKDPRFKKGNLLFSLRSIDTIGIIDQESSAIVWAYGPGVLDGQHQPTMLPTGNILVFDNGTYRGYSIIREIEPASKSIVWEYCDKERFFSPFRSGNQRLPNGNTFICQCDAGRLFEVTREGEVVWDFYNPFIAEGPHHCGKRIHRATRYSPEDVAPLLDRKQATIISEIDANGVKIGRFSELVENYQQGA